MEYDCRAPQGDGVLALGEEAVSQTIVIVMNGEKSLQPCQFVCTDSSFAEAAPLIQDPLPQFLFPCLNAGKILWLISWETLLDLLLT